ncbi:MAG TPA: oxygenase MpaB family protein [Dehalococcoidia bacterium]
MSTREADRQEAAGLAGPGSVAWKINGEAVVVLGWLRAILLQLAHPLVAAGVADHSTFRAGPLHGVLRFHATLEAMLALTFGTRAEAERAAAAINAIHDRVHGRLGEGTPAFPPGTPYSARDPALLRWVHATLMESLPLAYELYVGPLTPEEKDRYCAEGTALGPLLGIPEGDLPQTAAELQAYLGEMYGSGRIAVTETARTLAAALLAPPAPLPLRPALGLLRLHAAGLLPPAVRRDYGFRWTAADQALLACTAALIRGVTSRLPREIRWWPAARAALARAERGP